MTRFTFTLLVLVLTAGCGSSQRITTSDPAKRERLNASLQGKEVFLHLEDGTEVRAQNVCIEADSVSFLEWEGQTNRTIATRRLRTVALDEGVQSKAGVAVGAGAFLGGIGLLYSVDFRENPGAAAARGIAGALSTVFGLLIVTAAASREGERYRIETSQPEEGRAEKPVPSATLRITLRCR